MKINVWHVEQRTLTHPLTSGIHESKHTHVPKADILNRGLHDVINPCGKYKEIASLVNIYHN